MQRRLPPYKLEKKQYIITFCGCSSSAVNEQVAAVMLSVCRSGSIEVACNDS